MEVLRRTDPLWHEWARAKRYWSPLSLIAIDASGLIDPCAFELVRQWLMAACRDVDIACRTGDAQFCIILPSTNRTGAEAELARLIAEADEAIDTRLGKVGFGLAVAFDEANTPLELKMLAERDAQVDRQRPDPHETPTVPQLGTLTWVESLQPLEQLTVPHLLG